MSPTNPIRSLALTVYFKNPKFGMKKHEILSRASAFLLSVDPPDADGNAAASSALQQQQQQQNPYAHLEKSEKERLERQLRRDYKYTPAGGPSRQAKDLGWLEFCPSQFRPTVHVVASSHVLAPWMWGEYYTQDWVQRIKPEHCKYSVDVLCPSKPNESLGKFALNPYPIHHPNKLDISLIHLKQEDVTLKHMKNLGVEVLHLRNDEKEYTRGEEVFFEGFEVGELDLTDRDDVNEENLSQTSQESDEDTRVFIPYTTTGSLIFSSESRFLAQTNAPNPLPQGLCGGPVVDGENRVVGSVEGIVPKDHKDERLAGAAVFLPSMAIRSFLDVAERFMLEKIVPKELFEKIVDLKAGKALNQDREIDLTAREDDGSQAFDEESAQRIFGDIMESMKKHHSPEEVEAVTRLLDKEKEEVINILEQEGGDVDEVIERVRRKTNEIQARHMEDAANENGKGN